MAMASWRTASVTLLSFSSGLPLALIWVAIPDWMRSSGMDIRLVGLITLAHAPWSFKPLWSPLIDRYSLPWMGRRRGWIALTQVLLFALTLSLAGLGNSPDAPWVVLALALAIAFASASQDIAYDAYTVDVLKPEEQGVVVGAKTFTYRLAMYLAGATSITVAGLYSWPLVVTLLAVLYLPMLLVTWKAPEPPDAPRSPKSLKEAIWHPFLGFLGRHRALEILAFVFFYKFADNLAEALLRPFLVDMGYSAADRGVALGTIGIFTMMTGVLLGGVLTTTMGLGHSLWLFGFLQIFSNIGYIFVARSEVDRILMYGAMGFENLAKGLGTGAFMVLLLRMTQKRFSATQYALFSSLFALPRIVSGPISGFTVDAIGWEAFFWLTFLAGVPGRAPRGAGPSLHRRGGPRSPPPHSWGSARQRPDGGDHRRPVRCSVHGPHGGVEGDALRPGSRLRSARQHDAVVESGRHRRLAPDRRPSDLRGGRGTDDGRRLRCPPRPIRRYRPERLLLILGRPAINQITLLESQPVPQYEKARQISPWLARSSLTEAPPRCI
jgi:PAT family beta-lactamase induction signal transducer AmpG